MDTKGNDEVFLYKNPTSNTFNYVYADMLKKKSAYKGDTIFTEDDVLKVPNLKFFEEKTFNELGGTILEELMKENSDVLMRLKER